VINQQRYCSDQTKQDEMVGRLVQEAEKKNKNGKTQWLDQEHADLS
jgi:hypothetical protein